MPSKAEQIRNLSRDGLKPAEIVEQVDTSKSYVYKIRSRMDADQGNVAGGKQSSQSSSIDSLTGSTDGPIDSESQNSDSAESLELADTDAKTYDCGSCGETVEYLDKNCSECGKRLLWSKMDQ